MWTSLNTAARVNCGQRQPPNIQTKWLSTTARKRVRRKKGFETISTLTEPLGVLGVPHLLYTHCLMGSSKQQQQQQQHYH